MTPEKLQALHARAAELLELPANWHDEKSRSPYPAAVQAALDVAIALDVESSICPCADGRAQLEWDVNGHTNTISFHVDGKGVLVDANFMDMGKREFSIDLEARMDDPRTIPTLRKMMEMAR